MISKTVHSTNFGRALELSPKGKKNIKKLMISFLLGLHGN